MKLKSQALVLMSLAALATQGFAEKPANKRQMKMETTVQETKKPAAAKQAETQLHPVARALEGKGVVNCRAKANLVADFLTSGKQFGGTVFASTNSPNQSIASVSLEIQSSNTMQYAGLTFSPGEKPGSCTATYETVTYWNNSCSEVAGKLYSKYAQGKPLYQRISSLNGGDAVRVFLMTAGQGCVAVKKELLF